MDALGRGELPTVSGIDATLDRSQEPGLLGQVVPGRRLRQGIDQFVRCLLEYGGQDQLQSGVQAILVRNREGPY